MKSTRSGAAPASVLSTLLPILAVAFMSFLVVGMAMPVLPIHVHGELGMSVFVVGMVAGSQFAGSLLMRPWAGHYADRRGPKRGVVAGLVVTILAGAAHLVSLALVDEPAASVGTLVLGRALLGGAGSFVITGALSWGLALSSPHRAGKVMAWMGTATYASYAIRAPIGTALYEQVGFLAIALATLVVPLAALVIVTSLRGVSPALTEKPTVGRVLSAVGLPGLGLALCSIGSAAVTAFIALLFVAKGWAPAWPAFTAFAAAFIVARILFGHLADRIGGARVALVFLGIEALGQAVIWLADEAPMAMAGAAMTGFGYSLVFPGFGVEAVRRAPPQSRGLAMGTYTAFLDLAIGLASPALGFIASGAGLSSVFLVGASVTLSASGVAIRLLLSEHAITRCADTRQAKRAF
jgi:MFS family permease